MMCRHAVQRRLGDPDFDMIGHSMGSEAVAIAFEGASKVYGGRRVLDRVSLSIGRGEFLAVVGPSGSGKTTLLRLVNRLIEADEGKVLIDGEDHRALDPIALRRRIGYVFQAIGLFPHMTVAENIAITPRLLGASAQARRERADELLDLVRLPPLRYRDRLPQALSGGEAQRVGLARALAAAPSIMLMDEPFGALDPLIRDALTRDYRRLHDSLHLTTLMITHDMQEALLLADRIAVIHDGVLVASGDARSLAGQDSGFVHDLLQAPRRQAERLTDLLGRMP
jgi:osmoprotectant transport system ATP-binding protein